MCHISLMIEKVTILLLMLNNLKYSVGSQFEKDLEEKDYDKRLRPMYYADKPLHVRNQIYVLKLTSINEHDFTYEISYFIRQWWTDPRLASNDTTRKITYHQPPDDLIWLPELTLINSDKNEKVEGNVATHIDYKGNVFTSQRMKAKCSCIMDLAFYPMDTQHCPFKLESYAYSIDDLRLEWHEPPVETMANMDLSGYSLIDVLHEKRQQLYTVGNNSELHDNLILKFVVKRTFLYYLYRAYIPIMLLMVFNIGSYWVPDSALPARVTLIVTTFLTNVFILQSVSEQTVRVSSTTSLQVFIVTNIVMIVVAIIEYLTVLHLKSKAKLKKELPQQPANGGSLIKNGGYHLNVISSPVSEPTSSMCERSISVEKPKSDVHRLDTIFRFVAPVVYFVFCVSYFGYYLSH